MIHVPDEYCPNKINVINLLFTVKIVVPKECEFFELNCWYHLNFLPKKKNWY